MLSKTLAFVASGNFAKNLVICLLHSRPGMTNLKVTREPSSLNET